VTRDRFTHSSRSEIHIIQVGLQVPNELPYGTSGAHRCCSCSCMPRGTERWRNEETDHRSHPRSSSDITDQLPPPCSIGPDEEDGTRTRSILSHPPGEVAGCAVAAAEGAASAADALRWKVSWLVAFPWMLMSPLFDADEDYFKDVHATRSPLRALHSAAADGVSSSSSSSTNSCGNSNIDDDEYYCWLHVAWPKALDEGRSSRCVVERVRGADRTTEDVSSLGYGEILPSSVWTVLRRWQLDNPEQQQQQQQQEQQQSVRCVVDLGSGSGRALLAASLGLMWLRQRHRRQRTTRHEQHPLRESDDGKSDDGRTGCAGPTGGGPPTLTLVGIEIDPSWQEVARRNYQHVYGDGGSFVSGCHHRSDLVDASFVTGDFTASTERWTRDADLVLCHATVFSDNLLEATANACATCRPGTRFLFVSKPLVHPEIETLQKGQLGMSWGQATVYLQKRK
jgi:hypothetical protein